MLKIPKQITVGDAKTWNDEGLEGVSPTTGERVEFTSDIYTLSWVIRGGTSVSLTAVPNGSGYRTSITGGESQSLTPGVNFWQSFLTDTQGNRITYESGQLTVVHDLLTVADISSTKSSAKKMLEAVEAALVARATGGTVLKYEIKGRDLERDPIPDLIMFRDKLKMEVAREDAASTGMGDRSRLFVRFTN